MKKIFIKSKIKLKFIFIKINKLKEDNEVLKSEFNKLLYNINRYIIFSFINNKFILQNKAKRTIKNE